MVITTKYDVGDEVWYYDNRRRSAETNQIDQIVICHVKEYNYPKIEYILSEGVFNNYDEDSLFRTKQELIDSL